MNKAKNKAKNEAKNKAMSKAKCDTEQAVETAGAIEQESEMSEEGPEQATKQATGQATGQTETLHERITALEAQLTQAHEALDASERQRVIDLALIEADAVDVETARLLTEIAVTQMDEPDVLLAVSELKERKPFLFRRKRPTGVSAMGAHGALGRNSSASALEDAAEAALVSGDRASLLTYLRMRRTGEA